MAKLTMAQRKRMPSSSFALPGKGKGPSGKGAGSYPIGDKAHARNALARVSQHGTPSEKATVRAKVHRKFPDIGKKQLGGVIGRPRRGVLGGVPRVRAVPPRVVPRAVPRVGALMQKGGVASFKKPHTYEGGGVVKGRSGDSSPATCGNLKPHGGFAALGIKR